MKLDLNELESHYLALAIGSLLDNPPKEGTISYTVLHSIAKKIEEALTREDPSKPS